MKEFFRCILIVPFEDRYWLSYIMGIFAWIVSLAIVGLLLLLSIWLIDSSFLPVKQKEGVVTNKYYVPAHSSTTYVQSGNVFIPITTYYNEEYKIEVTIDELTDNVSLKQIYWNQINVEDKLYCEYTSGRLCKTIYIKNVYTTKSKIKQ